MSDVGQIERKAQDRVVKLFREQLGYDYLGNWEYREGNANIEVDAADAEPPGPRLRRQPDQPALDQLGKAASVGGGHDLYEANRDVYDLLRYGVKVKPGVGEQTETVWLIDWKNPEANHFAVAEEVTVARPAHQAPRRRALRQRPRARHDRAQALEGRRLRGHPPDHRQPEAGVHPPVLHDRAAASSPATTSRACATASSTRRRSTGWSGKSRPTSRTRSTGR